MKKSKISMLTLVMGIVAASCQKEAEPEIKTFEPMTINAMSEGIGTATKTEMIYKYDIAWSANDKILVTDGTNNDTFTLSSGEGTTKGTFKQDGEVTFTNDVQAYYPATMVQNRELVWPGTQTNDQTVPMYCSKTISGKVEDFNFTSLGAMLQIVFTTPQSDVTLKSIEITDGTKTMSGTFTVDENGKANITATDKAGITLNLGDGVSVSNKIAYFNIAVPAGNYQDLTLTFIATDGTMCTMTKGKVNIDHNTVGRLTLTGKEFKLPILQSVFSVSATKQVHFSIGNLWADGDKALHFESNQYSFASSWDASHVSHFTWSSTVADAVSNNNRGENLFCDESHKVSVDGGKAIYYALSKDEWAYLFNTRTVNGGTGKDKSYSLNITYGGKTGVVLYPDGYSGPALTSGTDYTDVNFPADCVFLPAAGTRTFSGIIDIGTARYWSSTKDEKEEYYAYRVYFDSSYVRTDESDGRNIGFSVRLVTDVK